MVTARSISSVNPSLDSIKSYPTGERGPYDQYSFKIQDISELRIIRIKIKGKYSLHL